jgi:hypothetical protein
MVINGICLPPSGILFNPTMPERTLSSLTAGNSSMKKAETLRLKPGNRTYCAKLSIDTPFSNL